MPGTLCFMNIVWACTQFSHLKELMITCTSNPCNRHLCCILPNICDTSQEVSPLTPVLSGREISNQLYAVGKLNWSPIKVVSMFNNVCQKLHSVYLVQLTNMILQEYLCLCVKSLTQRFWVSNTQSINVTVRIVKNPRMRRDGEVW